MLEFLAWDRHKRVAGLNLLIGSQMPPPPKGNTDTDIIWTNNKNAYNIQKSVYLFVFFNVLAKTNRNHYNTFFPSFSFSCIIQFIIAWQEIDTHFIRKCQSCVWITINMQLKIIFTPNPKWRSKDYYSIKITNWCL